MYASRQEFKEEKYRVESLEKKYNKLLEKYQALLAENMIIKNNNYSAHGGWPFCKCGSNGLVVDDGDDNSGTCIKCGVQRNNLTYRD